MSEEAQKILNSIRDDVVQLQISSLTRQLEKLTDILVQKGILKPEDVTDDGDTHP